MLGLIVFATQAASALSADLQTPAPTSVAGPANVQEIPWIAAAGDNTTVASLAFQGGVSLSVLCRDNERRVLLGGLLRDVRHS